MRVGAFYALSALLTLFLTFELFAHFLAPTPVVTDWAHGHHVHSIAHAVLTAVLIAAVAVGLHPRIRRIAGIQELLLITVVGFLVSVIAWQGIHNLAFPVFNFTLYGSVAVIVAALHPERGQLFASGRIEPALLVLALLAVLPLIVYAGVELSKQQTNAQPAYVWDYRTRDDYNNRKQFSMSSKWDFRLGRNNLFKLNLVFNDQGEPMRKRPQMRAFAGSQTTVPSATSGIAERASSSARARVSCSARMRAASPS